MLNYFSQEFDLSFYRSSNPDLSHFDDEAMFQHYFNHGKYEGRQASAHQTRQSLVPLSSVFKSCLEIGPFSTPFYKGENVYYFDVLDAKGLLENAKEMNHPIDTMPEVIHYHDAHGDMSIIDRQFDMVFSSHCIEHQPDLIRHLKQVESLLNEDGLYVLMIPDKRYCFDHYMTSTTLDQIIHLDKSSNTLIKAVGRELFATHNVPSMHWKGEHGEARCKTVHLQAMKSGVSAIINTHCAGQYIDTHQWYFWPTQFRYLMEQLYTLGHIGLRPARVYQTLHNTFEFVAVFVKDAAPLANLSVPTCEVSEWEKHMLAARQLLAHQQAQAREVLPKIKRFLSIFSGSLRKSVSE